MHNKSYKKVIVFAMCLTMLMPLGSVAVSSTTDTAEGVDETVQAVDSTEEETAEGDSEGESEGDAEGDAEGDSEGDAEGDAEAGSEEGGEDDAEIVEAITDEEAIALESCNQVADNANMTMYLDDENDRFCVYVKSSGKYWWSSPINVMADETIVDVEKGSSMKSAQRKQITSSAAIKVGDLRQEKRTESPAPVYSNKARVSYKTEKDGFAATYKYSSEGVTLTIHYVLEENDFYAYVDTSEIKEANTSTVDGKVLTKLEICPWLGSAAQTDLDGNPIEGYMIVPDGSGAVINYNNGKTDYADYEQIIYGRDYTAVPLNAPRVTEQAYMPVMATVQGNSGLVAVVTDGDSNVYAHAQVSGQNKQVYNNCYFEFETRSSDSFFMSGDNSNKITVFEKNGIKTERFGIRYYPVENSEGVNYADCAEVYRNYLIESKGLKASVADNKNDLYVDMFGGVVKQTSIVGVPFNLKTEITGFDQAGEIVNTLKEMGVNNFTVNYNDWTNNSIKNKISTNAKASGILGGQKDFNNFLSTENATVYPSVNNIQMDSSSSGYFTLTSTAIRISNAYSRQSSYSLSFGVAKKGVSPALLSPNKYEKMFTDTVESYGDKKITAVGFGDFSTKLVSDYTSKQPSSRNKTMGTIVEGYKKAQESVGNVIADEANAYVLPYVSSVSNVPVYSSGFNLTDMDIPFYQMVIHGYVSYSSTPINKSSNSDETFLLSLASGSQIHYDMTYVDADVLQDTDYNDLYYTNYKGWAQVAANQYKAAGEVLSKVSSYTISKYDVDGDTITTTYSKEGQKDVVVTVNTKTAEVKVDGSAVDVSNCIEGGLG